jgi:hypothetical protein
LLDEDPRAVAQCILDVLDGWASIEGRYPHPPPHHPGEGGGAGAARRGATRRPPFI